MKKNKENDKYLIEKKFRIILPKKIDIKDIFVAARIIKYSINNQISNVFMESYLDNEKYIFMKCNGTFIGYIPKSWLVEL